jgi:hypothetical protein
MSKQVNLALAAKGDVAVLRNGERLEIVSTKPHRDKIDTIRVIVNHPKIVALTTKLDGTCGINKPHKFDITDVLRNGASIFETD